MEKIKRITKHELEKFRCEDHEVVPALNKVYHDCAWHQNNHISLSLCYELLDVARQNSRSCVLIFLVVLLLV